MAQAHAGHTATLLADGRVLVVGGVPDIPANKPPRSLKDLRLVVEVYDPRAGRWSVTGSLDPPREKHTATLLADGRVLVVGGDSTPTATEVYDPSTGTWSSKGSLVEGRYNGHTATLLTDGQVLVVGGANLTRAGRVPRTSAEVYSVVTGKWSLTGSMTMPRAGHTATRLTDGRVLAVGGDSSRTAAEVYDPVTGKWSSTDSMTTQRLDHAAVRLADGRVFVVGGGKGAEIYDPVTGKWSLTGGMDDHGNTAVLLADGRVLVVGGETLTKTRRPSLTSAEVYDPVTGKWAPTAHPFQPPVGFGSAGLLGGFTVTLLADGRVLAVGGQYVWESLGFSYTVFQSSAEVYNP